MSTYFLWASGVSLAGLARSSATNRTDLLRPPPPGRPPAWRNRYPLGAPVPYRYRDGHPDTLHMLQTVVDHNLSSPFVVVPAQRALRGLCTLIIISLPPPPQAAKNLPCQKKLPGGSRSENASRKTLLFLPFSLAFRRKKLPSCLFLSRFI